MSPAHESTLLAKLATSPGISPAEARVFRLEAQAALRRAHAREIRATLAAEYEFITPAAPRGRASHGAGLTTAQNSPRRA